jgi:uncharacterized protein
MTSPDWMTVFDTSALYLHSIFLPVSRRLHPLICGYISDLVYDARLTSDDNAARQTLLLDRPLPPLTPARLRFVPVIHYGNGQSSEEDSKALADAYRRLIGRRFRDRDGNEKRMTAIC